MLQARRPADLQEVTTTGQWDPKPTAAVATSEIGTLGRKSNGNIGSWVPSPPKELLKLLSRTKSNSVESPAINGSVRYPPNETPKELPNSDAGLERKVIHANDHFTADENHRSPVLVTKTRDSVANLPKSNILKENGPSLARPLNYSEATDQCGEPDSFVTDPTEFILAEPSPSNTSKRLSSSPLAPVEDAVSSFLLAPNSWPKVAQAPHFELPRSMTLNTAVELASDLTLEAANEDQLAYIEAPQSAQPADKGENVEPDRSEQNLGHQIQQPSEPGASTGEYKISRLDETHYVSEHMPISESDLSLWEHCVKQPLKQALFRMSTEIDDYEAYGVMEFYMAGKRRDNLKPRIIITCCSTAREKELRRILKNIKWLKKTGLRPLVVLDRSFGYRKEVNHVLKDQKLAVEIRKTNRVAYSCGVQARFRAVDQDVISSPTATFTVGGVLLIDGQFYGLTTAHSIFFAAEDARVASVHSTSSNPSSESSDMTTSDEDSIQPAPSDAWDRSNFDAQHGQVLSFEMKGKNPIHGEVDSSEYVHLGQIFKSSLDRRNEPCDSPMHQRNDSDRGQDWAIMTLDNSLTRINSFCPPGDRIPRVVHSYVPAYERVAGQVYVLCESGPKAGRLHSHSVHIQLGISSFDVQQITLENGIAHGDSGSWVVHDYRLCGYIIAGRNILPWAYMLPIAEVLHNISQRLGGLDVRLPNLRDWKPKAFGLPGMTSDSMDQIRPQATQPASPVCKPSEIADAEQLGDQDPEKLPYPDSRLRKVPGFGFVRVGIVIALFANNLICGFDSPMAAVLQNAIVGEFGEVSKIAWVGVASALGYAISMLAWNKIYRIFNSKDQTSSIIFFYTLQVILYVLGNVLCGEAQNIDSLIFGRSLVGLGACGIYFGTKTNIRVLTSPGTQRLACELFMHLMWTFGLILGPFIGALFTDSSGTWRWAFYTTAAASSVSLLAFFGLLVVVKVQKPSRLSRLRWRRPWKLFGTTLKMSSLSSISASVAAIYHKGTKGYSKRTTYHWVEIISFGGSVSCFIMAITFGGSTFPWKSGNEIALWVVSGTLSVSLFLGGFITGWSQFQLFVPDDPTTVAILQCLIFLGTGSFTVIMYYLPLLLQFTQAASALGAAKYLAVLGAAAWVGSSVSQVALACFKSASWIRLRYPLLGSIVGSHVILSAAVLIYTLNGSHLDSHMYGCTTLLGFGVGYSLHSQHAMMHTLGQSLKAYTDAANVVQGLGSLFNRAIAGAIFQNYGFNKIQPFLPANATSADTRDAILGTQSDYFNTLSVEVQASVLNGINSAFEKVWLFIVVLASVACICSLALLKVLKSLDGIGSHEARN